MREEAVFAIKSGFNGRITAKREVQHQAAAAYTPREREKKKVLYMTCAHGWARRRPAEKSSSFSTISLFCSPPLHRQEDKREDLCCICFCWFGGWDWEDWAWSRKQKNREKGKTSRDRDTSVVVRYGSHRNFFVVNEAKRKDTHTHNKEGMCFGATTSLLLSIAR